MGSKESRIWTVPNGLSIIRILLVPLFIYLLLSGDAYRALVVFTIAAATDFLDGMIARTTHQGSRLGKFLDPAGDKLLMSASYILLTIRSLGYANSIPLWLTVFVFGRDLLIVSAYFIYRNLTHRSEIRVSIFGKLTTVCQMGVVFLVLFFNWKTSAPAPLSWLYILTLVLTLFSGFDYLRWGFRLLQDKRRQPD